MTLETLYSQDRMGAHQRLNSRIRWLSSPQDCSAFTRSISDPMSASDRSRGGM